MRLSFITVWSSFQKSCAKIHVDILDRQPARHGRWARLPILVSPGWEAGVFITRGWKVKRGNFHDSPENLRLIVLMRMAYYESCLKKDEHYCRKLCSQLTITIEFLLRKFCGARVRVWLEYFRGCLWEWHHFAHQHTAWAAVLVRN